MKRNVLVGAIVVLVAGVAAAAYATVTRREGAHHPHAAPSSDHAEGIDRAMAAALALYKAPEGATPCESAYNAFSASQDVAARQGVTPVVVHLAPREEFLARCNAAPSATQPCMVPRYAAHHRPECPGGVRSAIQALGPALELKPEDDPSTSGFDQAEPPRSP
jgi:hypothetical protein